MIRILLLTSLLASSAFAQSPPASPKVLKAENERYVFGQVGPARADQYLLDTQTGRLWQIVVDKEGRNKLQPVPIVQMLLGDESFMPETDTELAAYRQWVKQSQIDAIKKSISSTDESK